MSSENKDNRERLSKEELDRAMQERREKRAKARAKKDKRSGKSGTSAKTSASHTHAAKSAEPDLKGLLPKKETPKKDKTRIFIGHLKALKIGITGTAFDFGEAVSRIEAFGHTG